MNKFLHIFYVLIIRLFFLILILAFVRISIPQNSYIFTLTQHIHIFLYVVIYLNLGDLTGLTPRLCLFFIEIQIQTKSIMCTYKVLLYIHVSIDTASTLNSGLNSI